MAESAAQCLRPGVDGDIEGRVTEMSADGRTLQKGGESAKDRITVRTVYPAKVSAGMEVLAYGDAGRWSACASQLSPALVWRETRNAPNSRYSVVAASFPQARRALHARPDGTLDGVG